MKAYHHLSQQERYTITYFSRRRFPQAHIAKAMGRSPSTISRELRRNIGERADGIYRAEAAHQHAIARRRRARRGTQFTDDQWDYVVALIKQDWSPEQISGVLRRDGPFRISPETIYKYILRDKKKGGRLYKHLRIMTKVRRKRYNTKDSRGRLEGKRHISTRPKTINDRSEFGHWEADTVMGSDRHHCLLTMVERKTGFLIIKKLAARTAALTTAAAIEAIKQHYDQFRTITFDNGTEFHDYQCIEQSQLVMCYFATPYHSWERGTNENTNGLIRQYLPKGHTMEFVDQARCDGIAHKINTRPRKRFQYLTPKDKYDSSV
jgi:transposase, IS30 family